VIDLGQRWKQATERNKDEVQRRADRQFEDEHFDLLRGPTARRAVAGTYVFVSLAMVASWFGGTIAGVGGLAVWGVAFVALRLSVRSLADMPDYVLDERMRRERDTTYISAFRMVSSVVGIAVAVLFVKVVVADANDESTVLIVNTDAANAMFWGVFALVLGAPSLAMAWRRNAVI
jgi:hypothetical protein